MARPGRPGTASSAWTSIARRDRSRSRSGQAPAGGKPDPDRKRLKRRGAGPSPSGRRVIVQPGPSSSVPRHPPAARSPRRGHAAGPRRQRTLRWRPLPASPGHRHVDSARAAEMPSLLSPHSTHMLLTRATRSLGAVGSKRLPDRPSPEMGTSAITSGMQAILNSSMARRLTPWWISSPRSSRLPGSGGCPAGGLPQGLSGCGRSRARR